MKEPKPFDNFDFDILRGKNTDSIRNLPALSALHAHKNLAFIGPQGVGHDLAFYNYGGDHQECLAHIQRYLQDAIDNEPDLTWHKQMKSLFSEIIHEAKQDRYFSPDRILQIEKEYDAIVQTAREEYKKHPPNKYFPDGFNLLERMAAYKKNHLLFLSHPEIVCAYICS